MKEITIKLTIYDEADVHNVAQITQVITDLLTQNLSSLDITSITSIEVKSPWE